MSETSGFFDAELINEEYDREYIASQFANYFKLFIGNGVFVTPTDQLKVVAKANLVVTLKAGWAFIDGFWYYNSADLDITITPNSTASPRTDAIFVQLDSSTRLIKSAYVTGRVEVDRVAPIYELKLCEILVAVGASSIPDSVITDFRADNSVCGFVTGIVDVIQTEDLFLQFTSMFTTWFNEMKGQLTTDAAGNLQLQIDGLTEVVGNSIFIGTPGDITPTIPSNADKLGNQLPSYYAKQLDLDAVNTSLNVVEDDLASLTNWELLASSTSTAATTKIVNNLNDYKLIIGICVFTSTNVFYTPTILPLALFKIGGNNTCMINAISGSTVLSGRFEYLSDTSVSIAAASASAEIRLYGVK